MESIQGNTHKWTVKEIEAENKRRNSLLEKDYDPYKGIGCYGVRVRVNVRRKGEMLLPKAMLDDKKYRSNMSWANHVQCRIKYDFEFWCIECVVIKDKLTSRNIPFRLNSPQRRVFATLEEMRIKGEPIRMIMLKARQWGGSTLVQIYMAWIQIVRRERWNSLICGHLKDASAAIKGMYSRLLSSYPSSYWQGEEKPRFKSFERSRNVSEIVGRNCLVAIGSAESQEAIRGYDIAMAHLTEVAFWRNSPQRTPESLIRSVCGSVALVADSVIVLESTANGMGNYFHTEWLRSKAGMSDKQAVFVPWYEIEIYRRSVRDVAKLWDILDDYERNMWNEGLTLEMLHWYHEKRKEYSSHALMKAEYPSNDIEAFANTGNMVFDTYQLDSLRDTCIPAKWRGEIEGDARDGAKSLEGLRKVASESGLLKMWKDNDEISMPRPNRYYVVVDVGGVSDKSDYSVITVFDRFSPLGLPEVVAQWRGHTYHDLLAWKAAQIATWYGKALLIVESNTLETEYTDDGSAYILETVAHHYRNIYTRECGKRGFHTNVDTKTKVVNELIREVRDKLYVERDDDAIAELACYERKSNGGYGAMKGRHDDILMTRAIGLYLIRRLQVVSRSQETVCDLKE